MKPYHQQSWRERKAEQQRRNAAKDRAERIAAQHGAGLTEKGQAFLLAIICYRTVPGYRVRPVLPGKESRRRRDEERVVFARADRALAAEGERTG